MRRLTAALLITVTLVICGSCGTARSDVPYIYSVKYYQDIKDVTAQEIEAIEKLKSGRSEFSYGQMLETEAFMLPDGTLAGFAPMFCSFLSQLFGIKFSLQLYDWETLKSGVDNQRIDFTGDLTPTPERMLQYQMTYPIAERTLRIFYLAGEFDIQNDRDIDGLRVGSLAGTIDIDHVVEYYPNHEFKVVEVDSFDSAAEKLISRDIDVFVTEGVIDPIFSKYSEIISKEFFPLVYTSVSLTTANQELKPIIDVVNKYLSAGGIDVLFDFYRDGNNDYARHKVRSSFTYEEEAYIEDHIVRGEPVMIALEPDNYPISFYNKTEKEFQGIAVDVLAEISSLTGIRFETANTEYTTWSETMEMLQNGKVSLVSQLLKSSEREGHFLWSTSYASAYYALLSKSDYPNIASYQVLRSRVGTTRRSAFEDKYNEWFPENNNLILYDDQIEVLDALEAGDIDLLMGSDYLMLMQQNYREKPGYKLNIRFGTPMDSNFGFNINEAVLCSIINKAQYYVNSQMISDDWTSRGYDYTKQMAQQRLLIFIAVAVVLAVGLFLTVFSLFRKRKQNLVLDDIVKKRTVELENMTLDIRATVAKLKAVISSYSGVIWSVDRDFTITLFDGMYLSEIGVTPEFLEGKKLDVARKKNRHLDIIEHAEKTFLEGPQNWISDIDGKKFRSNTTPIYDENGAVTMIMGNIDDMTEIFQLQKDLEDALIKAEAANKAKSEFLSTMSHEIRTPMNAILGITEIQLQKETLEQTTREALGKIYSSGDMLLGIINDILDLSKIEAGKLELIIDRYEAASLISDTAQLNVMRIGSKPIEFVLTVDENLPTLMLGDELRVKQILNNLLSNAFKYTAEGTVELSIGLAAESSAKDAVTGGAEDTTGAGGTGAITGTGGTAAVGAADNTGAGGTGESVTIMLCVSDTGQGMTEEQVGKLFDKYSRFNMEANRTTQGTGLGMSITRNLIELMNGEIIVESEPGVGSKFTVWLPQGKVNGAVLGAEMAENLHQFRTSNMASMKRVQITREAMPYGSVLIVDDVETNIYVAKGLLTPYELTIDSADSGYKALDKIRGGAVYDIVFMDHMMPQMDGIETTQKLRAMGYDRPIVALTANAVAGQADIFLGNGFNDFISKPIDVRQLNAVLNKFIRDRQSREVIEAARAHAVEKQGRLVQEQNQAQDYRTEDGGSVSSGIGGMSRGSGSAEQDIDPLFAEAFARDARKALATLEAISERESYDNDDDLRSYVINVHGMKSALANVKYDELSAVAQKLEGAGREQDLVWLKSETPMFLRRLREFVDTIAPEPETGGGEDGNEDEDPAFLRGKLLEIRSACEEYDESAADSALTELREMTWSQQTNKILGDISEHLLHSDFDEVVSIVDAALDGGA